MLLGLSAGGLAHGAGPGAVSADLGQTVGEAFPELFNFVDADQDGLDDDSELRLGTDPLSADSDQDGWPDGAEVDAGSHPLDPNSVPLTFTWARSVRDVPSGIPQPSDTSFRDGFEAGSALFAGAPSVGVVLPSESGVDALPANITAALSPGIRLIRPTQDAAQALPANITVAYSPGIRLIRPTQDTAQAPPANVTVAGPANIQLVRPDEQGPSAPNTTIANPTDIDIDWETNP